LGVAPGPSVHPSRSVPQIFSKQESCRNFKFRGNRAGWTRVKGSKFEV